MKLSEFPQVTFILRNYTFAEIEPVAQLLKESSNNYALEVPVVDQETFAIIAQLTQAFPELTIGAGTVLTLEDLHQVSHARVSFVLSPVAMTPMMMTYCEENKILAIPGALTPTEIYQAKEQGAKIIKVFPINTTSASYLVDVAQPLAELKLMAVGGVNRQNARKLLANGVAYLGIGSGVFTRKVIKEGNRRELARQFELFEREM